MNINPQTLQSVSTRTYFLSAAASATPHTTNHSSTVTPGICCQKQPYADLDNKDGVKEVVDAHFSAAALAAAHATRQTSTVTPSAHRHKRDLLTPRMTTTGIVVVIDDGADGDYLDYLCKSAKDAEDSDDDDMEVVKRPAHNTPSNGRTAKKRAVETEVSELVLM